MGHKGLLMHADCLKRGLSPQRKWEAFKVSVRVLRGLGPLPENETADIRSLRIRSHAWGRRKLRTSARHGGLEPQRNQIPLGLRPSEIRLQVIGSRVSYLAGSDSMGYQTSWNLILYGLMPHGV